MPYFSLSIGPVQSFVAQARSEGDLQAGSFLLSWLAGVALLAVRDHAAAVGLQLEVIRPHLDFSQLDPLQHDPSAPVRMVHGSWPNKFELRLPDGADPALAERAVADVRRAWERLAQLTWGRIVLPALEQARWPSRPSELIWKRQVAGCFDITWGWRDDALDRDPLPHAKLMQFRHRQPEPGLKCSVSGDLQELSGQSSPGEATRFWSALRPHLSRSGFDVKEGEQLSAIALIKRFLRRLDQGPLGAVAGRMPLAVPQFIGDTSSVAHIARRPWARRRRAQPAEAELNDDPPPSYFAVLRMDVDQLGQRSHPAVLAAVSRFAARSRRMVIAQFGHPVYGAGDDLLALLPAETALAAAAGLREHFRIQMDGLAEDPSLDLTAHTVPSISAALVFAHVKGPLRTSLQLCDEMLTEYAKRRTGRDAVAIALALRGRVAARWSMPWERALEPATPVAGVVRKLEIQWLVDALRCRSAGDGLALSTRFVNRLRDLVATFNAGDLAVAGAPELLEDLVLAEYLHGLQEHPPAQATARAAIRRLLRQCMPCVRVAQYDDGPRRPPIHKLETPADATPDVAAALIARFLVGDTWAQP